MAQKQGGGNRVSRRGFLRVAAVGAGIATAAAVSTSLGLRLLKPLPDISNPLANYPSRDWESVYRDQYRYDSTFTFVCAPNDTHNCRLRAYVRNGILIRIEQAYDVQDYTDLYGNKPAASWNPRGCLKGYTLVRRLYGPYRIKRPTVRTGWKAWADAGFPRDANGVPASTYFRRGEDSWTPVSWDEASDYAARGLLNVMTTYEGPAGQSKLLAQGYHSAMVDATHGSGAMVCKLRAGMPLGGVTRLHGLYRFANMLALFDEAEAAREVRAPYGARGWSNYDWHGDLPPGHPMVTGVQTFDPDLNDFRNSKLLIFVGKNMVENKMADAHWWIEIIERGGKVVNISPEYSPASQKADLWMGIRPGSDVALILGIVNVLIQNGWYDAEFLKRFSDMPLLVRTDTLKLLRATDLFPGYTNPPWTGYSVTVQKIPPEYRDQWGDFVVVDGPTGNLTAITRENLGNLVGVDPALEVDRTVTLADGTTTVRVKTVFALYKELCATYPLPAVEEMTRTPQSSILQLARWIGHPTERLWPVSVHTGEGINHYFHCDLTTRAVFLITAFAGSLGVPGGNVGHWAGNYKSSIFDGLPAYNMEDPFGPNLDPSADGQVVPVKKYWKGENPAYWNYEDRPLDVAGRMFTGTTHMPTPTKVQWTCNVNLLNNAKWAYNMIANVDPKVDLIMVNDWEWTGSCEYADIVFPVQSWPELSIPDMTGSCSNPFLMVWKGGIAPLFDNKQDIEVYAGVAARIAALTGDARYRNYWEFVYANRVDVYLQRILDASSTCRGYRAVDLIASDKGALMNFRTYPRMPGWEQINESKPFYNKTGRLEFYREEDEFITYGENLIVHREPVEATPYLPNAIVVPPTFDAIRPNDFGIPATATGADERSVRNVKVAWDDVKLTSNFLWSNGYRYYCLTPKTRHRVHSSWSVADWNLLWDSNFGDPERTDRRSPHVGEHQINMNPDDAKSLGINDGDYVYVDANPDDRPYKGWQPTDPFYKVARLLLRAKYNPSYPRGVVMMKHAPFMATPKTVYAHETRPDGRAVSADTGYQANLRYGSQQSLTRGWLQPTMMTDSLVRKNYYGQGIGTGYEADIHSPNTCPKETLVRIQKAEDGGLGGVGVWEPATTGRTPGNENASQLRYLAGDFLLQG
ncbi:MAG TPA: molybdopterin-dependent oxidoreductase [Thermoplasmata archaeon]